MMPAAAAASPSPGAAHRFSSAKISRLGFVALAVLALAYYAWFLGTHVGAYASGSDSSGYLNNARLLSRGRVMTAERELAGYPARQAPSFAYSPLGFVPRDQRLAPGQMVPTYPIGVPLMVAGVAAIVGWEAAPHWTIGLHAFAGVILMWLLGRCAGLSSGWAAVGAFALAVSPLYLLYSLQMMSDEPATTWALATIVFAWLGRRDARWAAAAGFALGMAVLVRPTNLLLAVPAGIALGGGWRRWRAFLAGGVPLALVQALYNQAAYGNPLVSGYGHIESLFSLEHLSASLASYAEWLPVLLTPLGLLAVAVPVCARSAPRWTAVLATWMVLLFGVYALYYFTHETWWYLRFVLPAFPAAWVAALLVTRAGLRRLGWEHFAPSGSAWAWLAGAATAAAIFAYTRHWNRKWDVANAGHGEYAYAEAIAWMRPQVPSNAVMMTMQLSGALFYYTDLTLVRWDQIEAPHFAKFAQAAAAAGRPIFALLYPFETERAFPEQRLPGRWTKLGTCRDATLWRFEPGTPPP